MVRWYHEVPWYHGTLFTSLQVGKNAPKIGLLIDEKPFEWIFASTRRFFRRLDFGFGANQRPPKPRRILFSIEKNS
jgi:hypothetical protein